MNPERPGQIISQERLQDNLLKLLEDPQNTSINAAVALNVEDTVQGDNPIPVVPSVQNRQTIETSAATVTFSGGTADDSNSTSDTEFSSVEEDSESDDASAQTGPGATNNISQDIGCSGVNNSVQIGAEENEDFTETMPELCIADHFLCSEQVEHNESDGQSGAFNIPANNNTTEEVRMLIENDNMDIAVTPTRNYDEQIAQIKSERFNPFNKEGNMDGSPTDSSERVTSASSSWTDNSNSWPQGTCFGVPRPESHEVTNAELGLAEDHFSSPEGHFGLSTQEELEMAIRNCKLLILDAPEESDRRKNLVQKLVQLRMQLLDAKETPVEEPESDVKQVVGHSFKMKTGKGSKPYCEKCNNVIWGVVQNWYYCTACDFSCHAKCLNLITRTCASIKLEENPNYNLTICPEKGLSFQNYRCADCRTEISYRNGMSEPRQCDYSGSYFCEQCHWNDVMIIPARVLHNWDLEPRKVARCSRQFLKLMTNRAVLRLQDINPMLFNFVEELNEVKRLREEILIMKKYFLSCEEALKSKLLLQLQGRQHFVENSDMYSLQDLVDVSTDTLLPQLAKVHASFAQHIKTDCEKCRAKGYICELCDTDEVLFPFDNIAIVCSQCFTVLHRHCFMRRSQRCPKCERINKRTEYSIS